MSEQREANADQAALWNGASGDAWVDLQRVLDEMLTPFVTVLLEHALRDETRRVLDIGCGSGATTLATASRLGPDGLALGVDISAPLIELARKRASAQGLTNVQFLTADAQTHAFQPGSIDAVISRFGVMFFDDPVAAFTNIRRAVRSDGRLAFAAWRSPAENPFMTAAARAAAPLLPPMPTPDPNAPGQFGFADADRVRRILESSGWRDIDIGPLDVHCSLAEHDMRTFVTRLGPLAAILRELDERTRERVLAALHPAFDSFVSGGAARFVAACWLVTGRG